MVITSFHPIWGGAENQARLQASELVRRGHEVSVVTWGYDLTLPAREILDGITVYRVPRRQGRLGAARSAMLMGLQISMRIPVADVIVAKGVYAPARLAAIAAWLTRKPMAVIIATSPDMPGVELNTSRLRGLGGVAAWATAKLLARNVVGVAMTDSIQAGLVGLGFRRVVRIPNGVVDPGELDRASLRRDLLPDLGISTGAKLVVACGRLSWPKGFDRLLRAWGLRSHRGSNAFLLVVGDGEDREALRQMARDLGISDSVRFEPADPPRARQYLACSDAFVISSRHEGMANVLLEAMVAGVPVISSPVSGSVDLIQDGYNGRVVAHDDPGALISAIEQVLADPGELGERGRETVLASCRLEHVIDQFERLFAHMRIMPDGIVTAEQLGQFPLHRAGKDGPSAESAE